MSTPRIADIEVALMRSRSKNGNGQASFLNVVVGKTMALPDTIYPFFVMCLLGQVNVESPNGAINQLYPGDLIPIEPRSSSWAVGITNSRLLLIEGPGASPERLDHE